MIGGVSAALRGVAVSSARLEQAVGRMGAAVDADASASPAAVGGGVAAVSDAMVQMAVSRFAFVASLRAAQASNEIVAQTLQLGQPAAGG